MEGNLVWFSDEESDPPVLLIPHGLLASVHSAWKVGQSVLQVPAPSAASSYFSRRALPMLGRSTVGLHSAYLQWGGNTTNSKGLRGHSRSILQKQLALY